jgi:hypothetical protein
MSRLVGIATVLFLLSAPWLRAADGPRYCAHCFLCDVEDSGYPWTWECDGTYSKEGYVGVDCCGNYTLVQRPGGAWDYDPVSCSRAFSHTIMIACNIYHYGCQACAEAEAYYTDYCNCKADLGCM